ncbi:YbfB/YjiJ family MFS transporter [Salinibacillus xinjiangensis]|nr:YbfB/YjiJ family MFS transporter [Salinibacillus xinjiangensis]
MSHKSNTLLPVIGGISALCIVMGIGRFAYTPILPLMQEATELNDAMAGNLASSNYLGYLLGALAGGMVKWGKGKGFYIQLYLLINILTTFLMGLTSLFWLWFIFRFISGLTSGFVFVLASSIVLDHLARSKRSTWSGLFYSGVGIGIFITGFMVPVFDQFFNWQGSWIGLGLISLMIGVFSMLWLREPQSSFKQSKQPTASSKGQKVLLPWLIAAYGCEGCGYIISGTFLVALVKDIPALSSYPSLSWIFVGVAAIPSCIIWAHLAQKWGKLLTLQIAFVMQMIGVLFPILFFNAYGALIGALLFGLTFMGITTLCVLTARQIFPEQSSKVIGYLTCIYGIGQIIGPVVAGYLISTSGKYNSSLVLAAVVLFFGLMFLGVGQYKASKNHSNVNQSIHY